MAAEGCCAHACRPPSRKAGPVCVQPAVIPFQCWLTAACGVGDSWLVLEPNVSSMSCLAVWLLQHSVWLLSNSCVAVPWTSFSPHLLFHLALHLHSFPFGKQQQNPFQAVLCQASVRAYSNQRLPVQLGLLHQHGRLHSDWLAVACRAMNFMKLPYHRCTRFITLTSAFTQWYLYVTRLAKSMLPWKWTSACMSCERRLYDVTTESLMRITSHVLGAAGADLVKPSATCAHPTHADATLMVSSAWHN